ncbi:GH24 family phage-related lysozyme (muramidase) [Ancylobacter sp. 3268]|uniref:glycoside hydrolase family protein n=1 Tax=Ancylobacter sp. 3268 TaxID=2817752 RepID=UPI0028544C86|nr:peptidoglycan-binding protein [Ancylobacter sp. 3268]MDR6953773.1 GH24 family phage-related lysozyme (muramidase) [Ancylobacter sp. 3268]
MTAILRRGSSGPAVRALQTRLATLGRYSGAVDGDFGPATEAAVVAFQKAAGLYPDGIAGAKTEAALKVAMEAPAAVVTPAPPRQSMSAIGLAVLISREARKLTAYRDTKGIWTIGIGHTAAAGAPIPYAGLTITVAEADAIFARDIVQYEDAVRAAIKVNLADHQFDALTSVCYNIGTGAFAGATFVKRINAGESPARIRAAILMWRKPAEIISRRTGEADQFVTPYSISLPKARSTDARPISLAA